MNESDIANFIQAAGGTVWTTDEDCLDLLLWYGADIIWDQGPNMIRDGRFYLLGQPVDPAAQPESGRPPGCGRLRKGGGCS